MEMSFGNASKQENIRNFGDIMKCLNELQEEVCKGNLPLKREPSLLKKKESKKYTSSTMSVNVVKKVSDIILESKGIFN